MALPSLALVPPTPTYESSDSSESMESSPAVSFYSATSSTTTTINNTPSINRLSIAKPALDSIQSGPRRSSEEAAIVSIYSMYGDGDERNSWISRDRNSKYASMLRTSVQSESELAYELDTPIIDLTDARKKGVRNSNGNGNGRYSRPLPDLNRTTITTLSTTDESRPPSSYQHSPSSSPRGSLTAPSTISQRRSARDLPPIPQSQLKSTTPPGTPHPAFTPDLLEANSQLHQRSRSPSHKSEVSHTSQESAKSTSPSPSASVSSPPLKHRPQSYNNYLDIGSPSSGAKSKVSLVPSEGEDLDAFHVRNTYAQLDVSGVKGDGFAEGVERTRARIGDSRISQANAAAAIGDGTEKQGDLDPKELEVLSNIDRYGFFIIPNHERLVLLPSAPFKQRFSPVSVGPPNAPTAGISLRSLPPPVPPIKEASRIAKWERMLRPQKPDPGGNAEGWYVKPSKEGKLLERVYKGIPDRWRSVAWEVLMSRHTNQEIRDRGLGPDEMRKMNLKVLRGDYIEGLEKPSSYDIQIDLDVPRTISGHVLFKTRYGAGQRSLFHVLHSFSLRCPICGYVQGMGPIAATLLCYLPADQVYASLVRLHDHYSLHTIFSPGFPGLLEAIYIQERLTQQMMPGVYKALKDQGISTTSYATKWYITLFANTVPFQTQLRLWDVFFAEGRDIFVVFSVGIVWVFRDQITSSSANFETVLSLLSSFFIPEDENALMGWIEKVMTDSGIRTSMRTWREEWKGLVKEGKDMDALL